MRERTSLEWGAYPERNVAGDICPSCQSVVAFREMEAAFISEERKTNNVYKPLKRSIDI